VAFPYAQAAPATQADLTVLANVAGLPAASIPMGPGRDGLPTGLQIIGPRGADARVLAAAQAIERLAVAK
jgi:aspartyl-tRNA(Asn)/glutamyl-tRNA(Gln) amidotransferase subunit A